MARWEGGVEGAETVGWEGFDGGEAAEGRRRVGRKMYVRAALAPMKTEERAMPLVLARRRGVIVDAMVDRLDGCDGCLVGEMRCFAC